MMKKEKLNEMLKLQHELNTLIDVDWKTKEREWYRAAYLELSEAVEHFGFKWWKKTDCNKEQAFIEVIDVIHFAMSERDELFTEDIVADNSSSSAGFVECCEYVISDLTSKRYIEDYVMYDLFDLADLLGYDSDDIFKAYVAKNVLNIFRQKNGYQDGSYIKTWKDKEDNEVLALIMKEADSVDEIMFRLQGVYDIVKYASKYKRD